MLDTPPMTACHQWLRQIVASSQLSRVKVLPPPLLTFAFSQFLVLLLSCPCQA